MLTLQNEQLMATISPKGAELQQLIHRGNGINYMWGGGAQWPKHSPVLFPIVGALKQGTYQFGGNTYHLPRHGFARDAMFVAHQSSATQVVFTLQENAESLAVYPFQFQLSIGYQLNGATLSCTYGVHNPHSHHTLWFSLGAHPAFAVPLLAGQSYSDYYLQFNHPEPLLRHKLVDGLIGHQTEEIPAPEGRLSLSPSHFYEDAVVLKHLKSNHVTLASQHDGHGLHFSFPNFPYFGIWAAKDAPFVCLEPWCGIADGVNHEQDFTQKEGMEALPPLQHWERQWQVTCF
ncbi:MAG: aldose 1-epimerase family protein [Bacteroidetes bacterium]|nr:MAG: aldose 1-epimerase family protein [Bacteroidota bacterium]